MDNELFLKINKMYEKMNEKVNNLNSSLSHIRENINEEVNNLNYSLFQLQETIEDQEHLSADVYQLQFTQALEFGFVPDAEFNLSFKNKNRSGVSLKVIAYTIRSGSAAVVFLNKADKREIVQQINSIFENLNETTWEKI